MRDHVLRKELASYVPLKAPAVKSKFPKPADILDFRRGGNHLGYSQRRTN